MEWLTGGAIVGGMHEVRTLNGWRKISEILSDADGGLEFGIVWCTFKLQSAAQHMEGLTNFMELCLNARTDSASITMPSLSQPEN